VTGMLGIAPVTGAGQKAEGRTGPPKKGVAGERISAAGEPSPEYVSVSVIRKSTKRFCQSNFANLTSCQRRSKDICTDTDTYAFESSRKRGSLDRSQS